MAAVGYRYRGQDRNGRFRIGYIVTSDLAAWVKPKFRDGWRSLLVVYADDMDQLAAQIHRDPESGRRRWWSVVR